MINNLTSFVDLAQKGPILNGWRYIKYNYFPLRKVIDDNNPLAGINTINLIDDHISGTRQFTEHQMITYISASSISHLIDAWGYLSKSISALFSGNKSVSIHLAYYSELRAVMAFLASEGVGIFDRKHIATISDTSFDYFGGRRMGTHYIAWAAIEKWATLPSKSSNDLLKIFKVKGKTFEELMTGFIGATGVSTTTIIRNWLKDWAFDISKFTNDKNLRNFVSYRPQAAQEFTSLISFKETINKVYELFFSISPLQSDPFHLIDRVLLKNLFNELNSSLLHLTKPDLESRIESTFNSLGLTLDSSLKSLLCSISPFSQDHLIISESNRFVTDSLPIISRAILLLRVATGKISLLLNEASVIKPELEFIWEKYGLNFGLWDNKCDPNRFYELWEEIEQTYNELSNQIHSLNDNQYTIRTEIEEDINRLTQFNRAVLWGL